MAGIAAGATSIFSGAQSVYNAVAPNQNLVQFKTAGGSTIATFDLQRSETYSQDSAPTMFPVEDGTAISDNIQFAPYQIDLECVIVDHPITGIDQMITEGVATAAGVLGPLGVVSAAAGYGLVTAAQNFQGVTFNAQGNPTGLSFASPPTRSVQGYVTLKALQLRGTPFTVCAKLGIYKNMIIASMSVPRTSDDGDTLTFQMSLVQLRIATAQTLAIGKLGSPATSAGLQDVGEQSGETLPNAAKVGRYDYLNKQGVNLDPHGIPGA